MLHNSVQYAKNQYLLDSHLLIFSTWPTCGHGPSPGLFTWNFMDLPINLHKPRVRPMARSGWSQAEAHRTWGGFDRLEDEVAGLVEKSKFFENIVISPGMMAVSMAKWVISPFLLFFFFRFCLPHHPSIFSPSNSGASRLRLLARPCRKLPISGLRSILGLEVAPLRNPGTTLEINRKLVTAMTSGGEGEKKPSQTSKTPWPNKCLALKKKGCTQRRCLWTLWQLKRHLSEDHMPKLKSVPSIRMSFSGMANL